MRIGRHKRCCRTTRGPRAAGHAVAAECDRRPRLHERGFTLVELMLAAAFFATGMAGVTLLQVAAAQGAAQAGYLMMATTLAANAIEGMRLTPVSTLVANASSTTTYDRFGQTSPPLPFFTVKATANVAASPNNYIDLTATTSWTVSAVNLFPHAITMNTRVASSN